MHLFSSLSTDKKSPSLVKIGSFLLFFLPIMLVFTSCEVINPEEDLPAYIHIAEVSVQSDNPSQGTSSSKITSVEVVANNEVLGIFPLPATIPVLQTGEVEIRLRAGVRENGLSEIVTLYPFYTTWEENISLQATEVDTLNPQVFYRDDLNFLFSPQVDFENPNSTFAFNIDTFPSTQLLSSTEDVFEGNASGLIVLDEDGEDIEIASVLLNSFSSNASTTYLEMNFKTQVPILVGVLAYNQSGQLEETYIEKGVNVSEEWNKIYFNLSDELRLMRNANIANYRIVLFSSLSSLGISEARILLDNIKLIQN